MSSPSQHASASVAAITGGTAGIGLAIARRFLKEGWRVAICGRSPQKVESARRQLLLSGESDNILSLSVDLSQPGQGTAFVKAAAEHFRRLDVLVNNAAVAPLGMLSELSQRTIQSTLQVNHAAVLETIQAAWPIFHQTHSGLIINISSQAAIDPFPGFALYGASKSWLDALSKSLAVEGAPFGIRLFSVQPGAVETDLLRSVFPDYPAEKTLSPDAVADVVWRLAGPEFRFSSGIAVPIVPR